MNLKSLIGAFLVPFLAILIWVSNSPAFGQIAGSEHFSRADITVRFDKNGSLSIREELDYVKPRGVTKRGIFRELPGTVREGAITTRKNFRLTLATRNGVNEVVQTQSGNGTILWRLGRADVFLEEGVQKYVLEYNSDDWIVRYDDLDEVRWNVWGEYWPFPVKQLTGRIILPEGANAKQIKAYSGRYGQKGNSLLLTEKGNIIEFKSTKALPARNAATVSVGVEKGVFDPLSAQEATARWWRANGAWGSTRTSAPQPSHFGFLFFKLVKGRA